MNVENKNLNHPLVANHYRRLRRRPQQLKNRSWIPLLRGALEEIPKPGEEENKKPLTEVKRQIHYQN